MSSRKPRFIYKKITSISHPPTPPDCNILYQKACWSIWAPSTAMQERWPCMCHTYDMQGKGHLRSISISQCQCSRDPTTFSALPLVIQEFWLAFLGSWGQKFSWARVWSSVWDSGYRTSGCSGLRRAMQGIAPCPMCRQQKGGRKPVLATWIGSASFMAQF